MKEIFYFLLGASVGAVVALLFAPQSGEELRANIQTTADKDWQRIQAEWQVGMEKTQARLDQMQSDLKQVLQRQKESESGPATSG